MVVTDATVGIKKTIFGISHEMISLRVERLTFRSMGPSKNAIKISVPVHNIEVNT
ncbi:MAG TPA: hypothetical protein VJU85_09305 [Nitrososphaeraceae archaeon]|nr:hypothetical protein [Nitrososphaeraceae archaeon]